MYEKSIDPNLFFVGSSQSVLGRILIAEYLLGRGYLTSDLEELPPQVAKKLVVEACRFATQRLSELGFIEEYRFRLPFSLN